MLQLLSQSKLIVQIIVITIAAIVGVCSSPSDQSDDQLKETEWAKSAKSRTLFQVGFCPTNLQQFKNLTY